MLRNMLIWALHKGRPQRLGRGYGQMRTGRRGVKDLADVHKMTLL